LKWLQRLFRRLRGSPIVTYVIHVSRLGEVSFPSKKSFDQFVTSLGDRLERMWFEVKEA